MSQQLIDSLNAATKQERLAALRELMALYKNGTLEMPEQSYYVNNHIHTIYSFSPYSPTKAAYMAWKSGLPTAGIMDHDSVGGAEEFVEAGKIIGIATTVGMECRCSVAGTPFEGMRINNPDQKSVAYLALHGIPHQNIAEVQKFITPYREQRNLRNRKMVDKINEITGPYGITIDFDADVLPISSHAEGGSVTERHILYALSAKIANKLGRGAAVVEFLQQKLSIPVTGGNLEKLSDAENPMYLYYLLGVLKGNLVEQFYIDADKECPHITDFLALAKRVGGIAAYPYLGDIKGSVTGDKKDQTFEDEYLDSLVEYLAGADFDSITYMPTRNTIPQLQRLMALCDQYSLFQISGEDINTPFQSFICPALDKPEFKHLITATWALIGHEKAATQKIEDAMFSKATLEKMPALSDRIAHFAAIGRKK